MDTLIIDVNKPGLSLIRNDKKEILNKNFSELIEEKDKAMTVVWNLSIATIMFYY